MRAVVVTSINSAEAVLSQYLDRCQRCIVVGDDRSPTTYAIDVDFIDVDRQLREFPELAGRLPRNHYSRKNIGYLHALRIGAQTISEIDDDVAPLANWGAIPDGMVATIIAPRWPNLLKSFTSGQCEIWARGFPLDKVLQQSHITYGESIAASDVWIWQNWTSGAPDIDAVCRLTVNPLPEFIEHSPVALLGALAPFNSQNTHWIKKEAMAFAYLPAFVTSRYTDILRSYIAQRVINAAGGFIGYAVCDTFSARNKHDFLDDLQQETEMYIACRRVDETLNDVKWTGNREDLISAYEALAKNKLINNEEITLASLWLDEFNKLVP